MTTPAWGFDRHLRYDELVAWLTGVAADHPELVSVETYGQSNEGRDLLLITVTNSSTGPHDVKPAHWVDANIHATELTASVAACRLIDRLVTGHANDPRIQRALATRTFYIVPRVNPDGAELALADSPRFLRSSTKRWPRTDALPGLEGADVDDNGRLLQMRLPDDNGAWTTHPDDVRLLVPVPADGEIGDRSRYRLLDEGTIRDFDGWTVPTPRAVEGLDLNRNFPAGWSTSVAGAGDHPLSEPEIDALARAIVARPNICGSHAYHTAGGVQLRPSSTRKDSDLPPFDVWAWTELGIQAEATTGYPTHSVYEDFTWDYADLMSGAADDWAYEHLGIFSWTTEFWDVVHAATGTKQSTKFWYTGPTDDEALAVLRWVDQHVPSGFVGWTPFEHPQLGAIEIGGWDSLNVWTNPPLSFLAAEVEGHADVAVHQALAAPCLEIDHIRTLPLGPVADGQEQMFRVEAAVANTGWFATDVSAFARKASLTLPCEAVFEGAEVVGGTARVDFGQLEGRAAARFAGGSDGTPDRALLAWTVRASPEAEITIRVSHQRAGSDTATAILAGQATLSQ